MTYKGYTARVEVDAEAGVLHGEVLGLREVVTFQARCVDGLAPAFRESVDDYLAWCAERGEEPERPYSGRLLVRMEPSLHRRLAAAAAAEGRSINAFLVSLLADALHVDPPAHADDVVRR